jgi:hypothetical protein
MAKNIWDVQIFGMAIMGWHIFVHFAIICDETFLNSKKDRATKGNKKLSGKSHANPRYCILVKFTYSKKYEHIHFSGV